MYLSNILDKRMKILLKIFLFFTLFTVISALANTAAISQDRLIRTSMQHLIKEDHIPGLALLLYENGKMYTYYFGEADPEKHIPVSENTIFELGSVTKTFTSLLLAANVLANKIQLEDPINLNGNRSLSKITLQELATHTSSLPFNAPKLPYNAANNKQNKITLNQFLENWVPSYSSGSKMLYSNFGFGLLGIILARDMQSTLPALMQQEVLFPLGMNSSGLDIVSINKKNLATGFTQNGGAVQHLSSGLFAGSWAMKSSVQDMQTYLKLALLLPSMPEKLRQAMQFSQMGFYNIPQQGEKLGLGWTITSLANAANIHKLISIPKHYNFASYPVWVIKNPTYDPNTLIAKTGGTDGFRSYIAVIPKKQVGIVILANKYLASGDLPNVANKILFQLASINMK